MTIDNDSDLQGLLRIGRVVAETLRVMSAALEPGITTAALDEIGAACLRQHGARSAPILTYRYPGATCISINDQAAHGVPGKRVVQQGDLVNIDVSAELDGYFADTGASFPVPPVSPVVPPAAFPPAGSPSHSSGLLGWLLPEGASTSPPEAVSPPDDSPPVDDSPPSDVVPSSSSLHPVAPTDPTPRRSTRVQCDRRERVIGITVTARGRAA